MRWTQFVLRGRQLTHVQQDDGTNQCVAASLAMVCKNTGYSGHRFGEGSLYSHGAHAMRQTNADNWNNGISDLTFVSQYGVRHNAVMLYLRNYGFANVRAVQRAQDGAAAVAQAVNNLGAGDSAILACGVDAFHALAAFNVGGVIYILNPMPGSDRDRGVAYTAGQAVERIQEEDGQEIVRFRTDPLAGEEYWRFVDACFVIPSQWYLGTVKRWLFG